MIASEFIMLFSAVPLALIVSLAVYFMYSYGLYKMADNTPFLMYKGRPLVRSGNTLYYGSMAEKYVIVMQILSTKDENDMKMAEKIQVQLMLTDPEVRMKDRIVKKSEKIGLYNAMDIGSIWLERALNEK